MMTILNYTAYRPDTLGLCPTQARQTGLSLPTRLCAPAALAGIVPTMLC
jgi:hypothetical protein